MADTGPGIPADKLERLFMPFDLHLPGIGGEEVLRRLRADPVTAGPPVVVVSADVTRSGNRERLLAAGAAEYLTKPLDVPRFLEVVDALLAVASGPR